MGQVLISPFKSQSLNIKVHSLVSTGQSLVSKGQSLGYEGQSLDVKAHSFVYLYQSFWTKEQSLGDSSSLRYTFQGIINSGMMIPFLSTEY